MRASHIKSYCFPILPPSYRKMSKAQRFKTLRTVKEKKRAFEHLNKQAIDQFVKFNDDYKVLEAEQQQVKKDVELWSSWVDDMDKKKLDVLKETITKSDTHFREIFAELVRGGIGRFHLIWEDVPKGGIAAQHNAKKGGLKLKC
jgi:chromosome segregation ATPase